MTWVPIRAALRNLVALTAGGAFERTFWKVVSRSWDFRILFLPEQSARERQDGHERRAVAAQLVHGLGNGRFIYPPFPGQMNYAGGRD